MGKLYIVRHGETQWNLEGRIQGHKDSPLTELGIKQAKWLAEELREIKFDSIYSSSLMRAHRTAEIIRNNNELNIIKLDELKEINLGLWEGMLSSEIEELYFEEFKNFWYYPHLYKTNSGESYYDFKDRVIPAIEKILADLGDKNVLIITHTVVLKIILIYLENQSIEKLWEPPYIHPTSLTIIEYNDDKLAVSIKGDISHNGK